MNENNLSQKKALDFWFKHLRDAVELPQLGIYRHITKSRISYSFDLPKELSELLRERSKNQDLAKHVLLHAPAFLLFSKLCNSSFIRSLIPGLNPSNNDGFLISNVDIKSEEPFSSLLEQLQGQIKTSWAHQIISLNDLHNKLEANDLSLIELVNFGFSFKKTKAFKSAFDIHIEENNEVFKVQLNSEIADHNTYVLEEFGKSYTHILTQVLNDPKVKLQDVSNLSEEQLSGLNSFNNTTEKNEFRSLLGYFLSNLEQTPRRTALNDKDCKLSFQEAFEQIRHLHVQFEQAGVEAGDVVAVCAPRSIIQPLVLLACQCIGATYLPIDVNNPKDRTSFILQDANAKLVVTRSELELDFEGKRIHFAMRKDSPSGLFRPHPIQATDPCYIIYTSGSTGKPKGVVIRHESLGNYVASFKKWHKQWFDHDDHCLSLTNPAFDVALCEYALALTSGSTMYVLDEDRVVDPKKVSQTLKEERISFCYLPPVFLQEVGIDIEQNPGTFALKKLLVGVEAIVDEKLKRFTDALPGIEILNGYGPSETTVASTFFMYEPEEPKKRVIPIGKPLLNTQLIVVDQFGHRLPKGFAGELLIGGLGLANGYLNRDELTEEKFKIHPHLHNRKLYSTGDKVIMGDDGNVHFLGRIDNQLKVRGYRVEPGEIEKVLVQHENIVEALVIGVKVEGNIELCAYLVGEQTSSDQLRNFLSDKLPDFMIPSSWNYLPNIPFTPNGKPDRKKLPSPKFEKTTSEHIAPRTELEKKLHHSFEFVLKTQLGISDSFFDFGGNSLKAAKLVAHIFEKHQINIPFRTIFLHNTVEKLAQELAGNTAHINHHIELAPELDYYPLSHAQKRMYLTQAVDPEGTMYNMPGAFFLKGQVDFNRVESTFKKLIDRHEGLRTAFVQHEGQTLQKILPQVKFELEWFDRNQESEEQVLARFIRPFDLSTGELLRVGVCSWSKDEHLILIDMHHIVSDGVSVSQFLQEFDRLYKGVNLPEQKFHYKDFAFWLNDQDENEINRQSSFWTEQLEGLQTLELPFDHIPRESDYASGSNFEMNLSPDLSKGINSRANELSVTPYILFLTTYQLFLSKWANTSDISIGTVYAGRLNPNMESVMGMFVNTLPHRIQLADIQNVESLVEANTNLSLNIYENQCFPTEDLAENLGIEVPRHKHPYFQALFAYQNIDFEEVEFEGLEMKPVESKERVAKFDFTLEIVEQDEQFLVRFNYPNIAFKTSTIERLGEAFQRVLKQVLKETNKPLSDLRFVNESEQRNLETFAFGPEKAPSAYPTILHAFLQQTSKNGSSICVEDENESLTYLEVEKRSNLLASMLLEQGLEKEDCVGVLLPRSNEVMIAYLGILKAGGCFVPMDSAHPSPRLEGLVVDAGIKIILTNEEQKKQRKNDSLPLVLVNKAANNIQKFSLPDENQLAYVLYTSGSTGKPKGVEIEHGAFMHTLWAEKDLLKLDKNTVTLQLTNYVFDVALLEYFLPLMVGGKLAIPSHQKVLDFNYLLSFIAKHKVTNIQGTPSFYRSMFESGLSLPENHKLRVLCVGGESLDESLFNELRAYVGPHVQIDNHYGPTEASIDVITLQDIQSFEANIIGRPYPNTEIRIVDWQNRACGIGTPGEILISAKGLARGYRFDPEKSEKAFQSHQHFGGRRFYHTGDVACWTTDGQIQFLGRKDDQIKIRGQRVELGEISSILRSLDDVKYGQVLLHQQGADKYLVAYLKVNRSKDWRFEMLQLLPEALVPWHFVEVEEWPVTSNGKTDTKKLLMLGVQHLQNKKGSQVSASTETQKALVKIWSELLERESVGIRDNFFEIGGHSLKATQVIARVHKDLNLELKLADLFQKPTIEELALVLENSKSDTFSNIEPVSKAEHYPLSHAQRRLFVLHQFQDQQAAYNLPASFKLSGKLDLEGLKEAFQHLVNRHEALRTSFKVVDNSPVQIIADHLDVEIDFRALEADEKLDELAAMDAVLPFDLGQAPLVRLGVLELNENEYLCLFNMHHIISDGWSINILIEELLHFYNSITQGKKPLLEPLKVQYKDFSAWQNALLESDLGQSMSDFWTKQFEGNIPSLNLPTDRPRPAVKTNVGTAIALDFEKEISNQIQKYCQQKGMSPFMFVLALTKILMHQQSGQTDIIIGTPIAGRAHLDSEKMVGCFVNTLALRSFIDKKQSFETYLKQIKETTLNAYANQQYPFDRLVDEVVQDRDTSRSPLFDVMVIMENYDETEAEFSELKMEGVEVERQVSKFDLSFYFKEKTEGMHVLMEYNTDLFDSWRMHSMLEHMHALAKAIIRSPQENIQNLHLTPSADLKKIQAFNQTQKFFEKDENVVEWYNKTWVKNGKKEALCFGNESLTFAEVEELSNRVCASLHQIIQLESNDIVAICMERNLFLPVVILGILKAGAAYLPIDPNTPKDRLDFILEDSGAKGIITNSDYGISVEDLLQGDSACPEILISPDDLAYVIYTSGSTGKPKGVMIEHGALLNRLQWMQDGYPVSADDKILQKTRYTFDVSVWELLLWSVTGASLQLMQVEGEKDPKQINEAIEEGVTVMHFVPSMLSVWLEYLESMPNAPKLDSLRLVYTSGEALTKKQVLRFQNYFGARVQLVNKYGPTEAAIDVSYFDCKDANAYSQIPIGKPISNLRLYVLNEDLKAQPIGIPGELCIAGTGLARGYLNRDDLTSEKFIAAPHLHEEKIYRTGDLARWLSDGNLEYLGRLDFQVKIKGFRIELGEIEACILANEHVENVAVVAQKDAQNQDMLVAYFTAKKSIDLGFLRKHLQAKLPEYMVPHHLMLLPEMPLSPNGKIDRKKLPLVQQSKLTSTNHTAPKTKNEVLLAELWTELLNLENVYRESNFFHSGGDSIKAIQLSAKLMKLGLQVEIGTIFQQPILEDLAEALEEQRMDIPQDELSGYLELSPIQHRFFAKEYEDVNHYNQAVLIKMPKGLDHEKLQKAIGSICKKHDLLRARYSKENGQWKQYIQHSEENTPPTLSFANEKLSTSEQLNEWQAKLNIESGAVQHFGLIHIDQEMYLHWVAHHLVVDAVSWRILVEDLHADYKQLCEGNKIEKSLKTHTQKAWLSAWKNVFESENQEWQSYWEETVKVEQLRLPLLATSDEQAQRVSLNEDQTNKILKTLASKGYNVNDVLLAALSNAMKEWNGQNEGQILLEGHGRNARSEINLNQTVGWFTSIHPYTLKCKDNWTAEDLLLHHKQTRTQVPHEGASYDFWKQKQSASISEPSIEFNYLGQFDEVKTDTADFAIAPLDAGRNSSAKNIDQILLSINAAVSQSCMHIQFESRAGVDHAQIKVFANLFEKELLHILDCAEKFTSIESADYSEILESLEVPFQSLSNTANKHLFMMPPALGAYFAYRELSDLLPEFNVHAANFIVQENRLDAYMQFIEKIQPEGKIHLGGYSGGANLAFELGAHLEKNGRELAPMIFIDGKCNTQIQKYTEEQLDRQVESLIGKADDEPVHPLLAHSQVRSAIEEKIRVYDAFLYETPHGTALNTDILQITSSESLEMDSVDNGWSGLCNKFKVVNGSGMHREMLVGEHLQFNVKLIHEYLSKQTETKAEPLEL